MGSLIETNGRFDVPLGGGFVELLSLMASRFIRLIVSTEEGAGQVVLEGDFVLTSHTGSHSLHASEFETLGPVFELIGKTVSSAHFTSGGHLEVTFEGGATITAESDPDYENWELHAPGGILVVAVPGTNEEPAIWSNLDHRDDSSAGGGS